MLNILRDFFSIQESIYISCSCAWDVLNLQNIYPSEFSWISFLWLWTRAKWRRRTKKDGRRRATRNGDSPSERPAISADEWVHNPAILTPTLGNRFASIFVSCARRRTSFRTSTSRYIENSTSTTPISLWMSANCRLHFAVLQNCQFVIPPSPTV